MKRVSALEIRKALYDHRMEAIHGTLAVGRTHMPYNFDRFETDMLASGLLVDSRTIKQKWKILLASRVVVERRSETRGLQTYLDLTTFIQWMSPSAHALLASAGGESERVLNTVDSEMAVTE